MTPESCPKCNADFTGEPIPKESQDIFGGSTHFSRVIGIEDPEIYDGVCSWLCPDCKHIWNSEVGELRHE